MEKVIKDEKADVLEPKYLSMAAIAFPQSAMSALMKETKFYSIMCLKLCLMVWDYTVVKFYGKVWKIKLETDSTSRY